MSAIKVYPTWVVQISRGKAKPTITIKVNSNSNLSCNPPLRCNREAHLKASLKHCVQGHPPFVAVNRLVRQSPSSIALAEKG